MQVCLLLFTLSSFYFSPHFVSTILCFRPVFFLVCLLRRNFENVPSCTQTAKSAFRSTKTHRILFIEHTYVPRSTKTTSAGPLVPTSCGYLTHRQPHAGAGTLLTRIRAPGCIPATTTGCGPLSYSLDSMPPSWTGIHMYGYIHQSMFVPT